MIVVINRLLLITAAPTTNQPLLIAQVALHVYLRFQNFPGTAREKR